MSPRLRIRSASGPPPLVVGVLVAEFVIAGALLALGLPWLSLLAFAGPLIGLTLGLLGPTFQELGRRQPRLAVAGADGENVLHAGARPWPVDRGRILANEVAEAVASAKNRSSSLDNFFALRQPLATRPTEADHEAAQEKFSARVSEFETALGQWLDAYVTDARANADTFEILLVLTNDASGAFAEDVTVTIEVPNGVCLVEERPRMTPPPERPFYEPPRPRIPTYGAPGTRHVEAIRASARVNRTALADLFVGEEIWKKSSDGRRAEAVAGDVHPARSVAIDEPLLLRAVGPGSYRLRWSAYTKNARRAATGAITLEVPEDPPRPAFGRLAGITGYPDVPLVDEDGQTRFALRSENPPLQPETEQGSSNEALTGIRNAWQLMRWRSLGLNPADDGPEEVDAERSERRSG